MGLGIFLYVLEAYVFPFFVHSQLTFFANFFFSWLDFGLLIFGVVLTMAEGLKAQCGRNIAYEMERWTW